MQRLEARLTVAPADSRVASLAAQTYQATGQLNRAETAWRRAAELDPSNLDAYLALGQIYFQQNRLDDARREFERMAETQPKSPAAHTMIGFLLALQGRKTDALARYRRALEIDPRAAVAANNAAWLYSETGGSLDVAVQLAQTAKSGLPDRPEVNDTLGWIYYQKGMPSMAIGLLMQATDKDPKNAIYRFHTGMALAKADRKREAREHLEAALAIDGKFDGADEARRTLTALK
jgi:tetratricopeptide (TPR) repeat protein